MPSMPWVKLFTDFLDDRKIARLSDIGKLRFVQLILLAGECDAEGALVDSAGSMTIDDIAWRLRIDAEKLANELEELQQVGLITISENEIIVNNFSKRQGRPQSVKREQWRDAQQRHRGVIDDKNDCHTPRVEKSREEEEETPTQLFGILNSLFYSTLKRPVVFNPERKDVEALNRMIKAGITEDIYLRAIQESIDKGYTIVGPASIENPAYIVLSKQKKQSVSLESQGYRGPG